MSDPGWLQWHDAEKFLPAKPGVYLCEWEQLPDPKGTYMAPGAFFNYWTGRKWIIGSRVVEYAIERFTKMGTQPKPGTYINERCLKLVRWSFPPDSLTVEVL